MVINSKGINDTIIEIVNNIHQAIITSDHISLKEYKKAFDIIKKNKPTLYENIIIIMYTYFWIFNHGRIEDQLLNETLKFQDEDVFYDDYDSEFDEEERENITSFLHETDDVKAVNINICGDEDEFVELVNYNLKLEEALSFKSAKDIIEYVENNPDFLYCLINACIEFGELEFLEKRELFKTQTNTSTDHYISRFNISYFLEKFNYDLPITKEFLLKNKIDFSKVYDKDTFIPSYVERCSIQETVICLESLKLYDPNNFNSLLDEIIRDFYYYSLYLQYQNNIDNNFAVLTNKLEELGYEQFRNYVFKISKIALENVIYQFFAFNKLSMEEQQEIIDFVNNNLNPTRN